MNLLSEGSREKNESRADAILKVVTDIQRYGVFTSSQELGIVYGPHDLKFTDYLIFKWIKEHRRGK